MKTIWLIARNTSKEIIRDRILYGLVAFAIIFISVSVALGQLSYTEQARISLDFGLVGIQLSSLLVAIFVGSTLVSRELEKRTIFTLLAHAVTRPQFILGKFTGMVRVLFLILLGLFGVVLLVAYILDFPYTSAITVALYGIFLEAMLILAVTIFFGVFTTPMMTVIFSISVFLIGHWLADLMFFAKKSQSESFESFATVVTYLVPDLERFNWKSAAAYSTATSGQEILASSLYGVGWMGVFLCLGILIFRRRDFV